MAKERYISTAMMMKISSQNRDLELKNTALTNKTNELNLSNANLNQAIVDAYLRRGLLMPHVKEICQSYAQQMNTMLGLLSKCGGVARYTRPQGGLFIFAELQEGMDAAKLLMNCVDKGVAYVPGTHFYADGGHENTFRLNFSMSTIEQIERGMALLNEVFSANS